MPTIQNSRSSALTKEHRATLIGLTAIMSWSLAVGWVRSISNDYGPVGGMALMYTVASALLFLLPGRVDFKTISYRYLLLGGVLFTGTELTFSLSIGYAVNNHQAIEVSMINYLWPTFTMIAFILLNGRRPTLLIIPGVLMSAAGVFRVLAEGHGIEFAAIYRDIASNPLSYGLALSSAILWTLYCTLAARMSGGKNYVPLFFVVVATILWGKFLLSSDSMVMPNGTAIVHLLGGAAAMAAGYAAWNTGILHGNRTLLAGASYFIPVLSAAFAAFLLQTHLTVTFWLGAGMVCGGSVLCWVATRRT
ncbi:aromatic amino acid DMT transporter YddG [Acetobacter vaccinii]|uniref:Drug/metabolite DMT transporter permease n=1 Tax=Acetobacter vaccinii TaxID=2592655 RepID=A0A5C1YKD5_9PROT|nr:aromatic amino acid DMT transporter YddG [Acetobacter vaccinii]QEO16523.1 drug/metabolite DMT transporter permease [Acetobacter vaccinii]